MELSIRVRFPIATPEQNPRTEKFGGFAFWGGYRKQTALLPEGIESRRHVALRQSRRGRENFGFCERSETKDLVIRDRSDSHPTNRVGSLDRKAQKHGLGVIDRGAILSILAPLIMGIN